MSNIAKLNQTNNPNLRLIGPDEFHFINLAVLLKPAMKHGYGVGAINIRHRTILEGALEAAWQEHSPIIIEIAESEQGYTNITPKGLADMTCEITESLIKKNGYAVPVTLHMDHVQKKLNLIDEAIAAGFSSCEADLSKLPLAENIAKSKEVVAKCHPLGLSVELEEGEIGAAEALSDPNISKNLEQYVTTVEHAVKLVTECQPDAFAGFFGNGHGKYMEMPRITWTRIQEIVAALKEKNALIPIVMHGGSYLKTHDFDDQAVFVQAIKCGCYKFNYATILSDFWFEEFPKDLLAEMDKTAKEKNSSLRKMIGPFKEEINKRLSKEAKEKAKKKIKEHLQLMIKKAWLSSGADKYYDFKDLHV